jgi:hypothetical protein
MVHVVTHELMPGYLSDAYGYIASRSFTGNISKYKMHKKDAL